jgi:DNA replication protein DnaC
VVILPGYFLKVRLVEERGKGSHCTIEFGDRCLLEILEDRYQQNATIITTQLPIKKWHEFIDEATLADAILDRIVHNAYHIKLQARDSMSAQLVKK